MSHSAIKHGMGERFLLVVLLVLGALVVILRVLLRQGRIAIPVDSTTRMAPTQICQCNRGSPLGVSSDPPALSAGRWSSPSGNGPMLRRNERRGNRDSVQLRVLGLGLLQDGDVGSTSSQREQMS